jgi:predicted unusual protein kinase regulating ubiquinone biosynthesis (AarF/ABC1/UbiB family)
VTLEYTPGIKITDYDRLDDAAISRAELAELLLQTYLQMILVDGFFHADPHPGNVFAAQGPTLILVDFGMVGRITPRMTEAIRVLFLGIVRRDFDAIVQSLVRLNFVRSSADMIMVKRTVAWTVNTFYSLSFGELRDMDPRDVLEQTQEVFRAEAFQVPTNFAFLGRALGTLIGLCTGLDPSFQFMTTAEPYAREMMAAEGRTAGVRRVAGEMRNIALTTATLPQLAQSTLQGVGDLQWLQRDLTDITNLVVFIDRTLKAIIYGLLTVGFLVAGAFTIQRFRLMAVIFLIIAAVFMLRLLGFLVRSRRSVRR